MQDLKVIGVEDGALVAATENGERFRIVIDEVLQSHLRPPRTEQPAGQRLSPREIQAHIRSGMSADEVARVTGAGIEYVQRFEGPVLAEREHIVGSALSVPVLATVDLADDEEATFGSAIRSRLEGLGASGERWTSWKEPGGGWIVKLAFTAESIDHDARWSFEPKKHALAPLNNEAVTLSKQGEMPQGLIPRLRVVEKSVVEKSITDPTNELDESRFDSGAFTFAEPEDDDSDVIALLDPVPLGRASSKAASVAAINRADASDGSAQSNQTADLLEALRKRRGQREPAPTEEHNAPAIVDIPLADFGDLDEPELVTADDRKETASSGRSSKRGRASMPSWDEIVFGARTDGDD